MSLQPSIVFIHILNENQVGVCGITQDIFMCTSFYYGIPQGVMLKVWIHEAIYS